MSATHPASSLPPPYGAPISLDAARHVMAAAEAEAAMHQWPMVVAIVDSGGHLVMLHKHDQAQHASVSIAQRKAETAVNFRRSTKVFEDGVLAGGPGLRFLSLDVVVALDGGMPLIRGGQVVGAIGVSGMQSSQDAVVAVAGAAALAAI